MRALFVPTIVFVFLVLLTTPLLTASADTPAPPPYVVIVHPSNPITSASRKFVGDAFLKKTTRWPNGDVIRPVDQSPDTAVRRRFTDDVLKRSVAAVKSYWQQSVFSGRDLPPPELGSDEDVMKYVRTHEAAIGYVDGTARVTGVSVLRVE